MLAQIGRVAKWAEARGGGQGPVLSDEERQVIAEVMARVHGELARPFFALRHIDDMRWDEWVAWAEPVVQELVERAGSVLRKPEILAVLEREASTLDCDFEPIRAVSPDLHDTLLRSLAVGFRTDMRWARRSAELGGAEAARGHLAGKPGAAELIERRCFGGVGFGLAFILLLETLARGAEGDPERLRFLVLKIKRMAAISWSATRKLVAL